MKGCLCDYCLEFVKYTDRYEMFNPFRFMDICKDCQKEAKYHE